MRLSNFERHMLKQIRVPYHRLKRILRAMRGRDLLQRQQIKVPVESHGSDYGGWSVYSKRITSDSIIYSFGVGSDISFDLSLIDRYGCQIHAFDPTPRSVAWLSQQQLPEAFHFYPWGVAHYDGTASFAAPDLENHVSYSMVQGGENVHNGVVYKLSTIMNKLGHKHIDILKMDIEGEEYDVIRNIIDSNVNIHQLLIEFHHRFESIGAARTRDTIRLLNNSGYRIFHVSTSGEEYGFIKSAAH